MRHRCQSPQLVTELGCFLLVYLVCSPPTVGELRLADKANPNLSKTEQKPAWNCISRVFSPAAATRSQEGTFRADLGSIWGTKGEERLCCEIPQGSSPTASLPGTFWNSSAANTSWSPVFWGLSHFSSQAHTSKPPGCYHTIFPS